MAVNFTWYSRVFMSSQFFDFILSRSKKNQINEQMVLQPLQRNFQQFDLVLFKTLY